MSRVLVSLLIPSASSLLMMIVMANMSARDKVDKEIMDAERQLSEALSRLSRLRRQREVLGTTGSELLNRGLDGLEEDESNSPVPMSEEQSLVGQVKSLGAFGVVDWEAVGVVPYGSLDWLTAPEGAQR
jgi:hypothetical protein